MDFTGPPPEPEGFIAVRIHYADVHPEDITALHGIPVTTPARTLLDLASTVGQSELEHALETDLGRGLTNAAELLGVMIRNPRHPGVPRLMALLDR